MKQFPVLFGTSPGPRRRRTYRFATILAFATAAVCVAVPSNGRAQDLLAKNGQAAVVLPAAVTNLTALPDATIAVVTGMGLKTTQSVNGNAGSAPSIVLWDELRPTVAPPVIGNGATTITVNGVMQ